MSERPRTRGDCATAQRPCPHVWCRHHLAIEVSHCGSILLPGYKGGFLPAKQLSRSRQRVEEFLERASDQVAGAAGDTCALDAASRGGMTLDEISARFNVTRARAEQIEKSALRKVEAALALLEAREERLVNGGKP